MSIRIGAVGGGSWGTVLAALLAGKGMSVTLWCWEPEVAESINNDNENKLFLPGIKLPETLKATNSLEETVEGKDVVLVSTPSQHMRSVLDRISYLFQHGTTVVLASKGIENGTLRLMNQVAEESLPDFLHRNIYVVSGPTFARELAVKTPSAAVVAGYRSEGLPFLQQLFATPYFRTYTSSDVVGVEIGGALKNVIAISVGILEGAGLGRNSQAAIMTRAIAEITRLVTKMGGNPFTVTGLSGVGDMILTCNGDLSRNRMVGMRLGKGEKIDDILAGMTMVAEGVATSKSAYDLAKKMDVAMPIVEAVYRVIHEGANLEETFYALMERSLKDEIYGYGY